MYDPDVRTTLFLALQNDGERISDSLLYTHFFSWNSRLIVIDGAGIF